MTTYIYPTKSSDGDTVFSTDWFKIKKLPSSQTANDKPYYVLHRPDSVTIIPISPTGRTVLLKQARPPVTNAGWEFPMGHVDPEELAITAAKRELFEETGLSADNITKVATYHPVPGLSPQLTTVFFAKVGDEMIDKAKTPSKMDDIVGLDVIHIGEVSEYIKDGRTFDAFTIMAFYLLNLHFEDRINQGWA